jgi:D-alanine-D-alanine ligase
VSLHSGAAVDAALQEAGFDTRVVDPADSNWQAQLAGVDFVFNVLHGPGGEDGCIQGVLQLMGLPYSGSGVLGSALAMDKLRCKQLWQGMGIPTAGFVELAANSDWQALIERHGSLFVKPATEGSSIGMSRADSPDALREAWTLAQRYSGRVMAERFIDGPEYTVAVLGDRALPAIRIEVQAEFYDYEAKYESEDTRYHCPAGLSEAEEVQLGELALQVFGSVGCAVWGRVDLMREPDGTFQVLEVNTIPGMTSHSLVPMASRAAGMELPELVSQVVALSLKERR